MSKQLRNSLTLVNAVRQILVNNGISNDDSKLVHYKCTFKRKSYHFVIYGLFEMPLIIKTAYSESFNSNQADRYPEQIQTIKELRLGQIWFVFDGFGFGHPSYRRCNRKIRRKIGRDNVFHIRELAQKILDIKKASQN